MYEKTYFRLDSIVFCFLTVIIFFGNRTVYKVRIPNYFMKILEAFDKEVKGKRYFRYRINLPKKVVEDSKLKGKKLKATIEKNKIIIEKE